MGSLAKVPMPHAQNISAIADFIEIECLRSGSKQVSLQDVVQAMVRQDSSSTDEKIEQLVLEASIEIENRSRACGIEQDRYSFRVASSGQLIVIEEAALSYAKSSSFLYIYLLLATRMNMKDDKNQGGEDGTAVFEELSKEIAVRYWGGPGEGVDGVVFGTGSSQKRGMNGFENSVNMLCGSLGEGSAYNTRRSSTNNAKDGKLDVVVWRSFSDGRGGKLIGFGQCKTGTHWKGTLSQLYPDKFCDKYMLERPYVLPVRLFFVAERVFTTSWMDACRDAGILFDRCRIVEYASELPKDLLKRIDKWVVAACKSEGFQL